MSSSNGVATPKKKSSKKRLSFRSYSPKGVKTPEQLGWPKYDPVLLARAQKFALSKIRNKKNTIIYAAIHPTSGKPVEIPRQIKFDKRWKKWAKPVEVKHASNATSSELYDIYQAKVFLLEGAVIAKGESVWQEILDLGELQKSHISFGQLAGGNFSPWDTFQNGSHRLVYLTKKRGQVFYYDEKVDGIRKSSPRDWIDTITFASFATAGRNARGVIVFYKSLVYFAMKLIPGGFLIQFGITAASLALFWDQHHKEITECYEEIMRVVKAMQVIFKKAPKLAAAMLKVAIQDAGASLNAAKKESGIVRMVIDNLDGEKLLQHIAELFGLLLRLALTRHSISGAVAKGLSRLGLKPLAKIASTIHKAKKVIAAGGKVGISIDDPQDLVTKFMKMFADAGVSISKREAGEIISEKGISKAEVNTAIENLVKSCAKLETQVSALATMAEDELF